MKKEEKPKTSKAQEIKIRYEPGITIFESGDYKLGKMIFELGDKEFYLGEVTASFLFGRSIQRKFEHLQEEDESMGELNTLKNYVTVIRLMKKGLNLDHAARFLGYPQEKVRKFIGLIQRKKNYYDPSDFERETNNQSDEDYVKRRRTGRERPGEEPGKVFIDLLILRNDLRKGLKNKEISELFEVDEKDFDKFMEKNQKYLDLLI